jgi:hypothetical protein
MRMSCPRLILIACALLVPGHLPAQASRIDLVVHGGLFRPMQSFPGVEEGGTTTAAYLEASGAAFGVGAEARLPGIPVGLRASLFHARPEFHRSGPSHTDPIVVTDATVNLLVADAVISGPRISALRPYLLLGAGIKYYHLRFAQDDAAGRERLGERTSDPTVRLGLGLDLAVGRYGLRLEGSNHTSLFDGNPGYTGPEGAPVRSEVQHDLVYTVGLRVPVF